MNEIFKIYVEQLRDGHTEKILASAPPDFLDLQENELKFLRPVEIDGEAYLVDENLILHLDILTFGMIPCSICNELVEVEISIRNFYHMEPLAEIKSGIFYFLEILRDAILLEVPHFTECNNGNCPQRKEISKFLKDKSEKDLNDIHAEGYQPFADINLDKFKPKTEF